jgi:hypothetical protein
MMIKKGGGGAEVVLLKTNNINTHHKQHLPGLDRLMIQTQDTLIWNH